MKATKKIRLNRMGILWALLSLVIWTQQAWAQGTAPDDGTVNEAPQILTSDLILESTAPSETMNVSFVFIDTEPIVKILINGEEQKFEPSDTVMIEKTFSFVQPKTLVEVVVTDASGNSRRKTYQVYKPGYTRDSEGYIQTFVSIRSRLELDSNPIYDLSFPFAQFYNYPVQPPDAVPDSEQKDYRTSLEVYGGGNYNDFTFFGGFRSVLYRKPRNRGIESNVYFIGGEYQKTFNNSFIKNFSLDYVMMDMNVAGYDYSMVHSLSPILGSFHRTKEGTSQHKFSLEILYKDFSRPTQTDGISGSFRWKYRSDDAERMDGFLFDLAMGGGSDGYELTEYQYLSSTFDWHWRWESDFQLMTGFGFEFREFPLDQPLATDTFLGKKRRDIPGHYEIRGGYLAIKKISLMVSYRYEFSVSNKNPYKRSLTGLIVQGTF